MAAGVQSLRPLSHESLPSPLCRFDPSGIVRNGTIPQYWACFSGVGFTEGKIVMARIGSIPVRTRVPLSGWILAAVLTVITVSSSVTHVAANLAIAGAKQAVLHASLY